MLSLEGGICESSYSLAPSHRAFMDTDAKLEEHHVAAKENVCPATNVPTAAAAFGCAAPGSESELRWRASSPSASCSNWSAEVPGVGHLLQNLRVLFLFGKQHVNH